MRDITLITVKRIGIVCAALVLGLLTPAVAEDGTVKVELLDDAPAENLLASFEGPEADGMGWYRDVADWKDVGISFRAPTDGHFQRITFRLETVRDNFLQETKFRIEIYENAAAGENPLDGKKVYSGVGQLAVQRNDRGLYLAFDLGHQVPLVSGNYYSVLLIWEELATVIVLQANPSYTEGFAWYRNETTDGKFLTANDSSRPGLTYFLQ